MTTPVQDAIIDGIYEAKALGIPARRLYLGEVKMKQLSKELEDMLPAIGVNRWEPTELYGMKVVRSKTPGMRIGT